MEKKIKAWSRRIVVCLFVLTLLVQNLPVPGHTNKASAAAVADVIAALNQPASSAPAGTDISGHWAEKAIQAWLEEGLVSGFPDGRFRPDGQVTRAELAAVINRAFHYSKAATVSFSDVPPAKWYALDAARAQEAGYMQGNGKGSFRPEASVTREEAAVILARLLKLDKASTAEAGKFADAKEMAAWSRGAISAVVKAGVMKGYDGNLFKSGKPLTRAESVVLLDRVRKQSGESTNTLVLDINKAGTYGPASGKTTYEGDVAINVPNVVLRNATIKGNLLLGEGVGEGDVTLDGVAVEGTTTIKGGGKNSVHILNSTLTRVFVTKVDGQVRVVIEGSTAVDQVTVQSGGTLQVASGSSASYGTVTVSTTGEVTLDGDFPNVVLVAAAQLTVASGKVDMLTLTEQAAGADITLARQTQVGTVNADAASTIKGDGTIGTASVTSAGVTIAQKPSQTIVADGLTASVGGAVVEGSGASGAGTGTGTGGGSSVTRVTATVGSPSAGGFDLKLAPAVPNLTIANLVMVNADGMPALVSKVRTTDGGANYRAEGFLTGGAAYTLSFAMPGYVFGGSVSVTIPDVPAVTGAMVSPDLTKLVLLFSKPLAALPESPAGFALTSSGAPVSIAGATLSASATRVELALGASVNPNTLELSYAPGTIHSTDNKALPAFVYRIFTDGSTLGGRAAYDRLQGMTAEQAATDLKNNAAANASAAAKAMLEGGYNTNDLIKAMYTVYGVTNENMPDLLLPLGVSVYHLLIGLDAARILNLLNLGKNFYNNNGSSDDWVRALKQVGKTDVEVVRASYFFSNVKLAESMRKYYGTTNERAAKILNIYSTFSNDVGRVLREVYGNDDRQAVAAIKAAGYNASKAGETLMNVYADDANRAASLLKEFGYSGEDTGTMLHFVYDATGEQTASALSGAGYTFMDTLHGLLYASNPYAALKSAYSLMDYYRYMYSGNGGITYYVVQSLFDAGYSADEAARALKTHPDIHTRTEMMTHLLAKDAPSGTSVRSYPVDQAAHGVRQVFGGTLAENASMLAQLGVPTITTRPPGEITIAQALAQASFGLSELMNYLAPNGPLTQARASEVVLELGNMGFQLTNIKPQLNSLATRAYGNASNPNLVKLLTTGAYNTTTNQAIPGYSATDIAKYLIGIGNANTYNLASDLLPSFGKLEIARAMVSTSGAAMPDMIRVMSDTGLITDSQPDLVVLGRTLKEEYGATAAEAALALRTSYISSLNGFYQLSYILSNVYERTQTQMITDLAAAGFTTNQIGVGLNLNGQQFKDAGYNSSDVSRFLLEVRGVTRDQMAFGLKSMGYSLNEVTQALRNLVGGSTSQKIEQVTSWLNAQGVAYTPEEVTAAVSVVFGTDPFSAMAQGMYDQRLSSTYAAMTLKATFSTTDAIVMARAIYAAGYSREDVLPAILRTYYDGKLNADTVPAMDAVIAAVFPEVTNRLEATLRAANLGLPKSAFALLKTMNVPTSEAVGMVVRIFGLSATDTVFALIESMAVSYLPDAVTVAGAYFQKDTTQLYVEYERGRGRSSYDILIGLQQVYNIDDALQIARLMYQTGYSRHDIVNAIDNVFAGNLADEIARVLVQLFGVDNMKDIAEELRVRGYISKLTYPAIKLALPAKTQGEVLMAMKQARYSTSDMMEALRDIVKGDATAIAQLRNLGIKASDAIFLMDGIWKYPLTETIPAVTGLGYTLSDIGHGLTMYEAGTVMRTMRSLNYSFADIVAVSYAIDERPSIFIKSLYDAGWRNLDDLVKALKLVNCNPYDYAVNLWFGPSGPWTLPTVAQAISRNSPLTLEQLGHSLMQSYDGRRYFTDMQVYEALKAVADIGVNFIQSDLDSAISAMLTDLAEGIPFAIMREAGLSSNDAARVMKQLGWDWIPATIQLVQAGYGFDDTWGTLWDVYHNELGFQVLNIMSAVAPLASLGLADNLTTLQSVTRAALRKAMMDYFTHG
ncbi:S-layer homology domain-containing protein [Cohnella suwonensis]|uniref:S-layer homology domain-containing protein n=1 Tax=Cohnella suwonensis TaxID=696072 RepID=A0ABW0M0P1_9BACL